MSSSSTTDHEARIRAAAHLSIARMHLDTAEEAMAEEIGIDQLGRVHEARRGLDDLADDIMGPLGVANVLQTVEEVVAIGAEIDDLTGLTDGDIGRGVRERVIRATVSVAEAAREGERA